MRSAPITLLPSNSEMFFSRTIRVVASLALAIATLVAPVPATAQRGGPAAIQKTKEDVLIAMRDGVELAADIYLPAGSGAFPTLLTITPYGKNATARTAAT